MKESLLLSWLPIDQHGRRAGVGLDVDCVAVDADLGEQSLQKRDADPGEVLGLDAFLPPATYISVEAIRALTSSVHPNPSWLGIGPGAVTGATTPILAGTKRRTGKRLHAA